MNKIIDIFWTHENRECLGFAEYDGETIKFVAAATNITFDTLSTEECAEGITLEEVWADLLAQRDEAGRLNVTDVELK